MNITYERVKDWPQLPDHYKLGSPTGLGIDSQQHIFIFHRAGRTWSSGPMPDTSIPAKTILMLDRDSGKILNSWGDDLFIIPHGLTVDRNNDIWLTDVGLHQVFRFSPDGKLLMSLGEAKVPGNDPMHFNHPTDIAVAKDGSFYVSDGYGNSRVVKFTSTGEYLFEWGKKGDKEGEFNLPHAIDLDDEGNVYVADRENNRVQVFTPAGKFIKQWADKSFGKISSVVFDKGAKGFVAVDYSTSLFGSKVTGSDIIFFDASGNFIERSGESHSKKEGRKCWYHNVAVDDRGDIYITDILNNQIKKFKKV
jgi:peptidylamidoglycolate lyase